MTFLAFRFVESFRTRASGSLIRKIWTALGRRTALMERKKDIKVSELIERTMTCHAFLLLLIFSVEHH